MALMDEDALLIESILREDAKLNGYPFDDDSEWKTVSYPRRQRKQQQQQTSKAPPPAELSTGQDVFRSVDSHADERRRRVVEDQRAALQAVTGSKELSAGEDSGDDSDGAAEANDVAPVKKMKAKKAKKPKVSVIEAASKIDANDLAAFLIDISGSYESQEDIRLMRFADIFGRAFASVGSAQFPWMKMLKDSTVSKMVDIPLSQLPEAVYKTSLDWLNRQSLDGLGSFVVWLWDGILADFASHQGTIKGSKKVVQQAPSKSQVALFVVLAMTLRRKPEVLCSLLPILKESTKYVGNDKLPFTVWVIVQASQGDLVVALYMWVQVLLPLLSGKSVNPQSRDLILQLVERILSTPKARQILLNGAVRKGERLVPPAALEALMRLTFPPASARIKATDRFEAIYPTLKEAALAGSSGSKAMKQIVQQILSIVVKAAGEGVPELSKESSDVFIWCLTENPECYKQWDEFYLNNIKASIVVLRKLCEEGRLESFNSSSLEPLKAALNSFQQKNENALGSEEYADCQSSLTDADKCCKMLLAQLSRGHRCVTGLLAISVVFAVIGVVSKSMQSEDIKQLLANFNIQL